MEETYELHLARLETRAIRRQEAGKPLAREGRSVHRASVAVVALTIAAVLARGGQAVAQIEGPYRLMAGLAPGIGAVAEF